MLVYHRLVNYDIMYIRNCCLMSVLVSENILENWPKVHRFYGMSYDDAMPLYYQLHRACYPLLLFDIYISV